MARLASGLAPILTVDAERPSPRRVDEFVSALRRGGVVVYPTDTVYAIGACALDRGAVDRLYRIKRMDRGHPLTFVCADVGSVARFAAVSDFAYRWLRRLLPGPYTIVLEATRAVPRILLGERKQRTIGVRVPDHAFLTAAVRALDAPLVGTSAIDPERDQVFQDAAEIRQRLGAKVDLILDGGLLGTVPSTIISLVGDQLEIVREGKGPIAPLMG